ncbi:hypothetical protein EX30DRAFT_338189 [Ascodesmis nigricans]|uniref:HMG box domain-containing protein n=1 Tax=Ascodesmis nigricans TaxID=341454 RepID=A0A4S2N2W6_9PEZI|nr:hypothetical protein EX30DRAFT_338189 [Ascodesmis nigricans]
MAQLRHAADDATRTALAYFELMTGDSIMRVTGGSSNGVPPLVSSILNEYSRAHSLAPGARHTDEDDDGKKKRKRNVKPKDPNAPKKPATPFLLFCQTGRETVKGDLGPDASYQEVQDELKKRWNTEANKEEWSTLYQKRLAEWKAEKKEYDTQKEAGAAQVATAAAVAPMATVPVAIRGPVSPAASRTSLGFTAVNTLAKPGSAPAAEAGEEEEEEEEEDEEDEDEDEETAVSGKPEATEEAGSESESSLSEPPPKAKNSAKKNKNKATPIKPPTAVSSPIVAPKEAPITPAEQPKKKRGRPPKRPVEEPSNETIEVAQPAETPKRKRNKRRKSGASAE